MSSTSTIPTVRTSGRRSFFIYGGSMTVAQGKRYRLRLELTNRQVSQDLANSLSEEMVGLPQLQSMNAPLLAQALIILQTITPEEISEPNLLYSALKKQLDILVDPEFPPREEATATQGLRKKEDLLRYIRAILTFRQQ